MNMLLFGFVWFELLAVIVIVVFHFWCLLSRGVKKFMFVERLYFSARGWRFTKTSSLLGTCAVTGTADTKKRGAQAMASSQRSQTHARKRSRNATQSGQSSQVGQQIFTFFSCSGVVSVLLFLRTNWNGTRPTVLAQNQHTREWIWGCTSGLVVFLYLVFTRMPGESYRRWLGSVLMCLCDGFWALINSLVGWFLFLRLEILIGFSGDAGPVLI